MDDAVVASLDRALRKQVPGEPFTLEDLNRLVSEKMLRATQKQQLNGGEMPGAQTTEATASASSPGKNNEILAESLLPELLEKSMELKRFSKAQVGGKTVYFLPPTQADRKKRKSIIGPTTPPTKRHAMAISPPSAERTALMSTLKERREYLRQLRLVEFYQEKHDLSTLASLRSQWKDVCIQSLYDIQKMHPEKPTIGAILNGLGLDPALLHYQKETDDFA
jgi:hypothetical protein